MNRTIAVCALIAWVAIWIALTAACPWVLSDRNTFLAGFVNEQFLAFMGVVVTITLASAANLFLELNRLEDRVDQAIFRNTKRHVRHSAYSLIASLIASLILVVIKPVLICGERSEALLNGIALTIILFSIMILIDLTQAAFSLDARGDEE